MAKQQDVTPLRSALWAAENGSRRDLLVALMDKLWTALHDERTQPRDLSPITLRIKELRAEIEAIDNLESDQPGVVIADADFDPSQI